MQDLITQSKMRLKKWNRRKDELEKEHKGYESTYNYKDGFTLGKIKGKIEEIENFIEELNLL